MSDPITCKVHCGINYRDMLIELDVTDPRTGHRIYFDFNTANRVPPEIQKRVLVIPGAMGSVDFTAAELDQLRALEAMPYPTRGNWSEAEGRAMIARQRGRWG